MNTDKPLGAGLIAFGIAGIAATMQISVRTFNDDPGPQLFPIFGFAIMIVCGLGILLNAFRTAPDASPDAPIEASPDAASLSRGVVMFGLLVVYSLALWLVGFYVATPLSVYGFFHVIAGRERRVPWRGAVYALAVTGGVHLLFATFLGTLLPRGIVF
ncbi:tripartite tricarboxylate transporter TctB family protein [Antarctobacter sp.]|uniref:tripartite tricarboxylate transporter TctB family protein n=1 Tax=Antarctobacter sp. TaxID=1872577 RepID=UPI003A8E7CCF